ncbi:hypothetical protein [Rufibacter sp. LB8]|uniref:hypothetical protein n=1 Tax=Rufibacter sp. LB8 TaxID=2777781 RepID=UPI00178C302C|nr:hypothetical protein [Rufibacter sp. LB8]
MGLFDSFLKKKQPSIEEILNINIAEISKLVEKEFNTKVLKYGVCKEEDGKFRDLFMFKPYSAKYLCYLYIPIDENNFVITNNYYKNKKSVISFLNPGFHAGDFREDIEVCSFIQRAFGGGNIDNFEEEVINHHSDKANIVEDIDKIENVRYRAISYFVNDNFCTL